MNSELSIRIATKKDAPRIAELLYKELKKGNYAGHEEIFDGITDTMFKPIQKARSLQTAYVKNWLKGKKQQGTKTKVIVATKGNFVIGFTAFRIIDWNGTKVGYVPDEIVDQRWRGKGIFTKILKTKHSFYKENNVKYEYLLINPKNRKMLKIGKRNNYKVASIIMLKRLR